MDCHDGFGDASPVLSGRFHEISSGDQVHFFRQKFGVIMHDREHFAIFAPLSRGATTRTGLIFKK
jgi:hypothetical protein